MSKNGNNDPKISISVALRLSEGEPIFDFDFVVAVVAIFGGLRSSSSLFRPQFSRAKIQPKRAAKARVPFYRMAKRKFNCLI